ncbi:MAG: DNA polymerase III subunit gamma/tau [Firmicutes bacterium]|nr:DNA polymerase III subunit gamma/tau [Bacillota bacterium]
MYTALYRRYRPRTFDEMVGQEHIVKILKKQIRTGEIAHAYLFCGTRGTGKTSAARIFAKGMNCLSEGERPCGHCDNCESIQHGTFFDVIEIDAASNNRVENIRELRESVKYPPAAGRCKVYIIDEVHMLSTAAFNALLKTLEEPPEQVVFILATTEPHKLPATILSRCLRLDFRRVPEMKIRDKLKNVCEELGVAYEESALSLIAANGDGSVRDALSILEQCIPAGEKELLRSDVVEILGTAGEEVLLQMTDMLVERDIPGVLQTIERISADGKDILQFIRDWIYHFRNLMMSRFADRLEDIFNMSCENAEKVRAQGERMDMGLISAAIHELSAAANQARYSTQPRVLLELAVVKLMEPALSDDREALVQRLTRLEELAEKGARRKPAAESDDAKKEKESTIIYNNINNNYM